MNKIFTVKNEDKNSKARTGILHLSHGDVETPTFMPVGTNSAIKALKHSDLEKIGFNLMLSNTYHLFLRPGDKVIENYGSLHSFNNWDKNILTDSGGFQVFSLAGMRKIKDDGVKFRSHIDGAYHFFSPESVVDFQVKLNSDIQMVLDVCTAPDISEKKAKEAVYLTTEWAKKALLQSKKYDNYKGSLFGIIQGNFYKELRKISAEQILDLDFPGVAIGGLSVGESEEVFAEFLNYTASFLPKNKPHYLMGIGTPEYIFEAVENGIDMFDCVLPTRIARNGSAFTKNGIIALKKAEFALDKRPIEEDCPCTACQSYSRGFLRHMVKSNEILAPMLITEHNLTFLYRLLVDIRKSIENSNFLEFKKEFLYKYNNGIV